MRRFPSEKYEDGKRKQFRKTDDLCLWRRFVSATSDIRLLSETLAFCESKRASTAVKKRNPTNYFKAIFCPINFSPFHTYSKLPTTATVRRRVSSITIIAGVVKLGRRRTNFVHRLPMPLKIYKTSTYQSRKSLLWVTTSTTKKYSMQNW